MRVFLLRMVAAKNSMNRRAAWSPAPAITAGTASVLRSDFALTGAVASITAGRLLRLALAVQIYPAAGLGAGRATDRMALRAAAAGGARSFRNPGEAAQPLPDRGGPRHDEGQPQR